MIGHVTSSLAPTKAIATSAGCSPSSRHSAPYASSLAQVESALHAIEISLDADTLARLDAIFPGPGGEALEAYCW